MAAAPGSSPLARGLPDTRQAQGQTHRIIPARAGFTGLIALNRANFKDHPRSRGVYYGGDDEVDCGEGSSPLARGLRTGDQYFRGTAGIIPARAGFTAVSIMNPYFIRDHPRSRGVYAPATLRSWGYFGSSPLARGLPGLRVAAIRVAGIIPARAGFTTRPSLLMLKSPDHPRSRGVYARSARRLLVGTGSSPLARGLRCK